jgi:hypothetical protein
VRVSRDGQIWMRSAGAGVNPSDPVRWEVHDLAGRRRARLTTPPRLTVHDSGPGWVLGVWQDSVGVEFVRLYDVLGMTDAPAAGGDGVGVESTGPLAFTPVAVEGLEGRDSPLRSVAILQETFYASHGSYSASLDSLTLGAPPVQLPEGFELAVLSGDPIGWLGQARDGRSDTVCVMNMLVRGWLRLTIPPGYMGCWTSAPSAARPGG